MASKVSALGRIDNKLNQVLALPGSDSKGSPIIDGLRLVCYRPAAYEARLALRKSVARLASRPPLSFMDYVKEGAAFVTPHLRLPEHTEFDSLPNAVHRAANDALLPGGKKLRSVLSFMAADYYGIPWHVVLPIAVANELIQSASLIFDDLPAQDNATLRRGKPATHIAHTEATAQLAGLVLLTRSAQKLAQLPISPRVVLEIQRYISQGIDGVCQGQDLDIKLTSNLEEQSFLETILYLKTSLGVELSLVPVAMIAGASQDLNAWKGYARHFGVAYQLRDDLNDVEGGGVAYGKAVGMDTQNAKYTLVTALGTEGAKSLMYQHRDKALEFLAKLRGDTALLEAILNFAVQPGK